MNAALNCLQDISTVQVDSRDLNVVLFFESFGKKEKKVDPSDFDGWMDDLRFYVLFNSISVISGRCIDDNERLCAMELRLRLRRFHLE